MKKIVFFYKLCIVLGWICVALVFIIPISALLLNVKCDEDTIVTSSTIMLFVSFGFGTVVLLYPFIFDDLDISSSENKKPEKYLIVQDNPLLFLQATETSLKTNDFTLLSNQKLESFEIILYHKKRTGGNLYLFSLVITDELTDEILEKSNGVITECVEKYYNKKISNLYRHVTVISLFCVNRITKAFRNIVNSEVEQGLKNGRFIAGASFGGNKLYVVKQNSIFDMSGYKKYRKLFFTILGNLIEKIE